jgi:hypothetical protein
MEMKRKNMISSWKVSFCIWLSVWSLAYPFICSIPYIIPSISCSLLSILRWKENMYTLSSDFVQGKRDIDLTSLRIDLISSLALTKSQFIAKNQHEYLIFSILL